MFYRYFLSNFLVGIGWSASICQKSRFSIFKISFIFRWKLLKFLDWVWKLKTRWIFATFVYFSSSFKFKTIVFRLFITILRLFPTNSFDFSDFWRFIWKINWIFSNIRRSFRWNFEIFVNFRYYIYFSSDSDTFQVAICRILWVVIAHFWETLKFNPI